MKTLKIPSLPSFDSVIRFTPAAWDSSRQGEARNSKLKLQKTAFPFCNFYQFCFLEIVFSLAFLSYRRRKFENKPKNLKPLKIPSPSSFDSVIDITSAAWDSCRRGDGPKFEAQTWQKTIFLLCNFYLFCVLKFGTAFSFLYLLFLETNLQKDSRFQTFD